MTSCKRFQIRGLFSILNSIVCVVSALLKLFQSLRSPDRMSFILSRSLKCIIFLSSLVIHGLLEPRTRLDWRGACISDTSRKKVFHFSHISLGLRTPLRLSHGWAKMSERKLLRLKCLNCLCLIALVPLTTEGDEILW